MSELATNDQMLTGAHRIYTDELAAWMGEIADYFNPAENNLKPFYIHMKRYNAASLEEVKPYIGDVYIAEAKTSHEALAKLVAFNPDGYVAVDLNQDAGGNYVYMAYKRVAKSRDALTDIVVYEGKKFEPTRRITIGNNIAKYSLVADIDLNCNAGGKYLYMYTTDSKYAGGAIMSLEVKEQAESSVKCGVERITARRAEGSKYTDEQIDLNKNAGGDYLYLIMSRVTTEGHTSNGIVTEEIYVEETCADDGYRSEISQCVDCGISMEIVVEVIEAHGMHIDDEEDGDHYCDECGADEASAHKWQNFTVKSDLLGGYAAISRCAECGEEKPYSSATASLIGNGSFIAVISIAGIAILAAIIIYLKRRTTTEKAGKENEK